MRILLAGAMLLVVGAALGFAGRAGGQVFDEDYAHWPEDLKINGDVIVGNGLDAELLGRFLRSIGQQGNGRAKPMTGVVIAGDREGTLELLEALAPAFAASGVAFTNAPHGGGVEKSFSALAEDLDFLVVLRRGELDVSAKLAAKLHGILSRGGIILWDGPTASLTGTLTLAGEPGLGLLPDCIVMADYSDDPTCSGALLDALAVHPRAVGVGIQRGTAVHLSGRKVVAAGEGLATFLLAANDHKKLRTQTIAEPKFSQRQSPQEFLIDLTEWRRDSIDRALNPFPPAKPRTPHVKNGSLVIVGGGAMPDGLMERFIELAGGKKEARLVFVPCSERESVGSVQATVEEWKQMGVAHATFIHTKNRKQANADEEFLLPLVAATGIWFGGGRQWNFADSYYGTKAHELMKEVLLRGGVIGGSSAGASVQPRYLARATPIGNHRIMAPGYERGGLGFISGVAIDQHFSQRGRQKDMTFLMQHHPQLLGIGIDEGTALIVTKSQGAIVGAGKVFFYDRNIPVSPGLPDYVALGEGARYDLAKRQVLPDPGE